MSLAADNVHGPRRAFWTVVFTVCFLALPWLGEKPFFTRGEPREALVAQSMFQSGDYVLPEGYGGVVPSKPPALHWLISLGSWVTGEVSEFTARMPSAVASVLFIAAFFLFLQRRLQTETALVSCLVLFSSLEWYRAATTSRVDMLLACLLGAGLIELYRWEERRLAGVSLSAVILFAGATLAKGPVALVVPGAIWGLYLLLRKYPLPRVIGKSLIIFLPAAVLASTWYWLAFAQGGQAFIDKVYYENVARFAGTMEDEPHDHSVWYLYGVLVLGLLPWSIIAARSALGSIPRGWKIIRSGSAALGNVAPLRLYFALIIVVFITFFSIPSSKRGVYLLPIYPFVSAFIAMAIVNNAARFEVLFRRAAKSLAFGTLVLTACMVILAAASPGYFGKSRDLVFVQSLLSGVSFADLGLKASLLVLPVVIAVVILSRRGQEVRAAFGSFMGLLLALYLSFDAGLLPLYAKGLSSKAYAAEIRQILPLDENLYSFENEFYALSFDLGRRISRIEEVSRPAGTVFLYERDMPLLRQTFAGSHDIDIILRSSNPIIKPGRHLVAVRISERE